MVQSALEFSTYSWKHFVSSNFSFHSFLVEKYMFFYFELPSFQVLFANKKYILCVSLYYYILFSLGNYSN